MNRVLARFNSVVWCLNLLGLIVVTYFVYVAGSRVDVVNRAEQELEVTRSTVAAISKLREEVPDEQSSPSALSDKIERVRTGLAQCGIPESTIQEIGNLNRTPIPKSAFTREDVAVRLREIALEKILAFAQNEEQRKGNVVCSAINLRSSNTPSEDDFQLWDIEIILSQIVRDRSDKKK